MAFVYANIGSGPSANAIGWFDFGPGFTLTPGQTVSLSGTLGNNITVSFNLTLGLAGGTARNYAAVPSPVAGAYFGLVGYTGLTGFPVLLGNTGSANNLSNLIFSNITVKNALGDDMSNYTMIVADGENTSGDALNQEGLSFTTNGGNWATLTTLGNTNPPNFVGGGTFVGLIGVSAPPNTAYVFSTLGPKQVTVGLSAPLPASRNGIVIGFAATQIELYKVINGRRFPADQFDLSITGSNSNIVTTSGGANGLQSIYASLGAAPGTAYLVNEAMAAGSTSALADYIKTVSVVNLTPGGAVPPVTPLPESITPALGDILQYTITNNPAPIVDKTVTPAFAAPGDTLTYTVTVTNPDSVNPAANVLVTDTLPGGVTYADNLLVSVPHTGTDPMSGITLTSIPAGGTATVSWNVTVNAGTPPANPISNTAVVSGTGFSYTTPAAETQVNYADISSAGNFLKTASPAGAAVGDTITYTITLNNSGTVAADNVVITDNLPAGVTFVPGSVTGATGTPPTLTLSNPIAAGGSATVTFQVTVDANAQSPIANTAAASYNFTIDPANPNGGSGSGTSTSTSTPINMAVLTMEKTAAPAGVPDNGVITYTITLTNTGNTAADNVIITDNVPAGTTFVPGSVTGATGSPPALALSAPIAAGGTAVVTFQVTVNPGAQSPVSNTATAAFTFTADPANPDGKTGSAASNTTQTQVNNAIVDVTKTSDKTYVQPGDIITYTITLKNTGNVAANNVVITDTAPAGTTLVPGSVTGASGTLPTLTLLNPIAAGGTSVVTFKVQVNDGAQGPIVNTADVSFTFTADPANPDGATGTGTGSTPPVTVSYASLTSTKTVTPAYADTGTVLTYTITLENTGNAAANNVIVTDPVPAGTTFVPGSVTGASGTPPTLTALAPVPAGGTAVITYQVKVSDSLPNPNPILNKASTAYTYTIDPAFPNGASAVSASNTASAQINTAKLSFLKSADKTLAYIGNVITYQLSVTNNGNVPANNVVITDPLPAGTQLVPGSLTVSVPYTGTPAAGIQLTNPVLPGQTVTASFKLEITAMPNPNPIVNVASAAFSYTVDPENPDGVTATASSNSFTTVIFRFNYAQQISDLIESVALEEAALAAIANAEGAKIQAMVAMGGITTQELLCLNKSVTNMMDSISMLESVLKQKLNAVSCQINGSCI